MITKLGRFIIVFLVALVFWVGWTTLRHFQDERIDGYTYQFEMDEHPEIGGSKWSGYKVVSNKSNLI